MLARFFVRLLILLAFRRVRQHRIRPKPRRITVDGRHPQRHGRRVRREPPFDAVLNHWDEMVAYVALCSWSVGLV